MRILLIIAGVVLAAAGGVVAYRAAFVEPRAAIVISAEGVRETPHTPRVIGGTVILVAGAALAFDAARRRR